MHVNARKNILPLIFCSMVAVHGWLALHGWGVIRAGYPDFTTFYSAATIVRQGQGRSLYDEALQTRVKHEVAPGMKNQRIAVPYMHAPFEALLFVPFTTLP